MSDVAGTPAASFPKASFDGIEFPYEVVRIRGGIRSTMHEFSHSPGGELEKQGRRAYVITFKAIFHDVRGQSGNPTKLEMEYPDLYPTKLNALRAKFEKETTGDLVIPNVGKIKACAVQWEQAFDVRVPSGEAFDLEFVEDQEQDELVEGEVELGTAAAVTEANDSAQALAALADFKLQATLGVFQEINDAVTAFEGALGQIDAMSNLVAGKLEGIANLCSAADSGLEELQDPVNHLVVDALKDLWLSARQLAKDVTESRRELRTYNVRRRTTIGEVATDIYGDASRGTDIMQINAIPDPLEIQAGTQLRFLPDGPAAPAR